MQILMMINYWLLIYYYISEIKIQKYLKGDILVEHYEIIPRAQLRRILQHRMMLNLQV